MWLKIVNSSFIAEVAPRDVAGSGQRHARAAVWCSMGGIANPFQRTIVIRGKQIRYLSKSNGRVYQERVTRSRL
jgi:hypothetical protein